MVLIFDGEEGGAHNTWDYLHLMGPALPAARERSDVAPVRGARGGTRPDGGHGLLAGLAGAAAGITLGLGGSAVRRRGAATT